MAELTSYFLKGYRCQIPAYTVPCLILSTFNKFSRKTISLLNYRGNEICFEIQLELGDWER